MALPQDLAGRQDQQGAVPAGELPRAVVLPHGEGRILAERPAVRSGPRCLPRRTFVEPRVALHVVQERSWPRSAWV